MTRNINPFLTFYNTYSRLSDAKIIENLYCGISMGFSPSLSFGSVLADHQVVYCSQRRNSDGSRTVLRIESCHTHIQDLVGDQLVLTNDYKVNSNKKKVKQHSTVHATNLSFSAETNTNYQGWRIVFHNSGSV